MRKSVGWGAEHLFAYFTGLGAGCQGFLNDCLRAIWDRGGRRDGGLKATADRRDATAITFVGAECGFTCTPDAAKIFNHVHHVLGCWH